MGRHRLPNHKRRSLRINVRLSAQDVELLEARKAPTESRAAFLRDRALKRNRPEPVREVSPTLLRMLDQYCQRINHQAHAANLGATVTLTPKELAMLAALLRLILKDLEGEG